MRPTSANGDMTTSGKVSRYLISRRADPVFTVCIGVSAALIRIRREEIEKQAGQPSASIATSPAQQRRIDEERELKHQRSSGQSIPLETKDRSNRSIDEATSGQDRAITIGYIDVIRSYWEKIKWKVDYEWHDRRKEIQRKDGRIV